MALLLDRGSRDYCRTLRARATTAPRSRQQTTASRVVRKSSTMPRHRQRAGALVGKASLGISARTDQVSREPKFEIRLGCPATGNVEPSKATRPGRSLVQGESVSVFRPPARGLPRARGSIGPAPNSLVDRTIRRRVGRLAG